MAFVDWEDSLGVKIPEFDSAHKKLIGMINSLHEAMKQGKGKDALAGLVKDLSNYTKEHFSQEEGFMQKYEYSGLAAQMEAHKKFVDKVTEIQKDLEDGKPAMAVDVLDFLKNWLVEHIKVTDAKYSAELAGKPL
ncbi:MAG: bacteriohemerythrin [Spirochaetes bacterium]|nr:bacteriohemerythrin [Spirochaetota bacterium]